MIPINFTVWPWYFCRKSPIFRFNFHRMGSNEPSLLPVHGANPNPRVEISQKKTGKIRQICWQCMDEGAWNCIQVSRPKERQKYVGQIWLQLKIIKLHFRAWSSETLPILNLDLFFPAWELNPPFIYSDFARWQHLPLEAPHSTTLLASLLKIKSLIRL